MEGISNMLKYLLIVAALFAATPLNAEQDENWYHIHTDDDGTEVYFYVQDAFQGPGGRPKAWMRYDSSKDATVEWREMDIINQFDCSERSYQTLQITLRYSSGKVRTFPGERTHQYIVPGTVIGFVLEAVCSVPR